MATATTSCLALLLLAVLFTPGSLMATARNLRGAEGCGPGEVWDADHGQCSKAAAASAALDSRTAAELPSAVVATTAAAAAAATTMTAPVAVPQLQQQQQQPLGPSVACERFTILVPGSDLAAIAATFRTTVAGLRQLNPMLGRAPQLQSGVGTPLCVVGTVLSTTTSSRGGDVGGVGGAAAAGSKRIGKRPASTISLVTTPGVHTCYDIITRAQPPLDITTFVEMNPTLDCSTLPEHASTVYLPKGTDILMTGSSKQQPKVAVQTAAAAATTTATTTSTAPMAEVSSSRDCVVSDWGDWTGCSVAGTQVRFRTIYQQATGAGVPCPHATETRGCSISKPNSSSSTDSDTNSDDSSLSGNGTRRMTLSSNQCPAGYNGCSVPSALSSVGYYHLFVPACNLHDICYGCNRHKGWEFATKSYCDSTLFYAKMRSQCASYWSKWWQAFNRAYCETVASMYFAVVVVAGDPDRDENPPNDKLWADGCYWKPWDTQVNNVQGGGFHPAWAGCPCTGTSCQYWQ